MLFGYFYVQIDWYYIIEHVEQITFFIWYFYGTGVYQSLSGKNDHQQ